MVPVMFVPAIVAEAATKLEPAFEAIAVVRNCVVAGPLKEMPLLAMVPVMFVPAIVAEAATKFEPAFEAIAVVRN
jgi:hypothetical protein